MRDSKLDGLIFRQLFDRESCTYTYILGDVNSKVATIIDPVIEHVDRDYNLLKELGFDLRYAVNTHVHADHITGSGLLKGKFPSCRSVLGKNGNEDAKADIKIVDGELLFVNGKNGFALEARHTPGHTAGCHTFVLKGMEGKGDPILAFTGDTVLIRGCGRTDFQSGSSEKLYKNVHAKIFSMNDDVVLYPAHDYKGFESTTVGEEKKFNPRLTKNLEEFKHIMANLNLAYPKKIDESLPANKVCGLQLDMGMRL